MTDVEIYAGAGGTSEGAQWAGARPVGIELDPDACRTAHAAGHPRIRADVAAYPTEPFSRTPVRLLAASPPCQPYSRAGQRRGARDGLATFLLVDRYAHDADEDAWRGYQWADPRSHHAAQPVRWINALRPEAIFLEQVPDVLPLWQHIGRHLTRWGYSVWTGVLNAADHGVIAPCHLHAPSWPDVDADCVGPNYRYEIALATAVFGATTPHTAEAASLAATVAGHLAREIRPAFAAGATRAAREQVLRALAASGAGTTRVGWEVATWTTEATSGFGPIPGTAESIASLLSNCLADHSAVEKWSTISTEIRQTIVQRISRSIAATLITGCGTGPATREAGCGLCVDWATPQTRVRAILLASRVRPVRPPEPTHYDPRRGVAMVGTPWVSMADALGWGADHRPAPTVTGGGTGGGGGVEIFAGREARDVAYRNGSRERAAVRPLTGPAPTIHFGHSANEVEWVVQTNSKSEIRDGEFAYYQRGTDRPAPTVQPSIDRWTLSRPATTIAADPRIPAPGHRDRAGGQRQHEESIRVTVQEAAILQGFPADYPWQGTCTSQYTQVGNAVPPPLAEACVAILLGGGP